MDQERKVIREERRIRMNVSKRVQKWQSLICITGVNMLFMILSVPWMSCRILPGTTEGYYNDFYRPDQQAVMIIGDIDVEQVETTVKRLFESIPKRKNPKTQACL